jgi:hypothetical protein
MSLIDESTRIKMRMENTKAELSTDFGEMVRFYACPARYWRREMGTG